MRALWFLTIRLLVNSLRRALRRPLVAIVFVVWAVLLLMGMSAHFMTLITTRDVTASPSNLFMSAELLTALLMLMHVFMFWTMLAPGASLLPIVVESDVNFLFPSPLNRMRLFVFLLLVRGLLRSALTLLVIVIVLLGFASDLLASLITGVYRPQWWLTLVYPAMYLLAFYGLLAGGVLILIREAQVEGFRDHLRRALWVVVGVMACLLAWRGYRAQEAGDDFLQGVVQGALHDPLIAVPLVPVRSLAEAALAFCNGWTPYVTAGFLLWGSVVIGAVMYLKSQQQWLYEAGARLASLAAAYRAQQQNPLASVYLAAAQRKRRHGFAYRWALFDRWAPQGVWAMLWCNCILLLRSGTYLLTTLVAVLVLGVVFGASRMGLGGGAALDTGLATVMQYVATFYMLTVAQTWIGQSLKRAEFNKSLPFPATQVVLVEVLPTTLLLLFIQILSWSFALFIIPRGVNVLTYNLVVSASLALPLNLSVLSAATTVPSIEDYIQRSLLPFVSFLAMVVTVLPTALVAGFSLAVGVPLWQSALMVVAVNALTSFVLTLLAGRQYVRVNPAE